MLRGDRKFTIRNSYDIVQARQHAREIARELGFGLTDQTRIATAVSEVSRHVLSSKNSGDITLARVRKGNKQGVECTCCGGKDLEKVVTPGEGRPLGGIERLMDEFELKSQKEEGVIIIMRKWQK
jgi:serine/threonine-protein kinase RsbT